jgi:hypothetical protein
VLKSGSKNGGKEYYKALLLQWRRRPMPWIAALSLDA